MQYQLSRLIAGPFLRGLWRPRIIGAENIPDTGGAILASNHLSVIDSVFLPLMLKRPVTFAAKSEYFTGRRPGLRLMGVYLKATGQLPVDREGARAAQAMLEGALALLQDGELFGIYPEGTRSPDGLVVPGPAGCGLAGPEVRAPRHSGGHDRDGSRAAARPDRSPAGADRDTYREADDVRGRRRRRARGTG